MDLAALEESLSRPPDIAVAAMQELKGDLVVLGAGGKMGPSLARMAVRALARSGSPHQVIAVARFTNPAVRDELRRHGVCCHSCDLLEAAAVAELPDAGAIAFLVGTKFGTTGHETMTWATNAWLPGLVAARYPGVPTVVFSSGNVYPLMSVASGGATEETAVAPIGEYAWSVLARERMFEHFSRTRGTPTTIYRLNYAAELRYGIPLDVALRVRRGEPVDLANGHVNVIWQGDANALALACFDVAATPPRILNVTGPETILVRDLARSFARRLGRDALFTGTESDTALLSNSSRAWETFGAPSVSVDELVEWVAEWVVAERPTHEKPTHFEVRDGTF